VKCGGRRLKNGNARQKKLTKNNVLLSDREMRFHSYISVLAVLNTEHSRCINLNGDISVKKFGKWLFSQKYNGIIFINIAGYTKY